ncbi:MAG TPA: hypothetical protein PLD43_11470 [Anaerolineae bacterium]|nr:hypothetical protein [Anaerolineae bacterium]
MRVQQSGGTSASTARSNTLPLLLGLIFLAAFGLGYLAQQQHWGEALAAGIQAWVRSPKTVLTAWRARQQLPTLTVDLRFADYERLSSARERALQQGVYVPLPEEAVTARVTFADARGQVAAELRLPGGAAQGAADAGWTLELRPAGARAWRRLTPVVDAAWAWRQWGYLETLRRNGFAAATLEPVRLIVNGSSWGLYLLETPVTEALTVGFDARAAWQALAEGEVLADGGFRYAAPGGSTADDPAAPAAWATLDAAFEGERALSSVTDAEALGRFVALTMLWTGAPAPDWASLRWSYDPATGQLAPLGSAQPADIAPLPEAFFDDPAVQTAIARALVAYSQPGFLETLRGEFGADLEAQGYVLGGATWPGGDPWQVLTAHQRAMRARVAPEHPLRAMLEPAGEDFVLRLTSLQPFPLEVTGLDVGGVARRALDPAWVRSQDRALLLKAENALVLRAMDGELPQTVELLLPREALAPGGELTLFCRVWDADAPEGRVAVLETLPLFEETP